MKQPIEEPFGFSIERTGPHVFTVTYSGHMPETAHHLDRTESIVLAEREPVGLLYEVPGFTSFHRSQVSLHGAMFARLGKRVTGIAVVGARPLVRFGATTVGLISKTPLTSFDTRGGARVARGAERCRTAEPLSGEDRPTSCPRGRSRTRSPRALLP